MASIVALAAIIAHVACGGRAERAALGHDAYIWQRQWTASLDRAVIASASRVRAWRVLAAEIGARGDAIESSPHLDVLARSARPVIPVIRISGGKEPANDLMSRTLAIVRRWRDAGVHVTGVEIDHDCPTGSLRRYAAFLAGLRAAHQRDQLDVTLSITALPTWLDSALLRDVLQQVDEAVLQVHAVQHPAAGLFDADQAGAWARAWAEVSRVNGRGGVTGVPFRIALPTYGSRVTWTRAGRITAIESEARTFADPAAGRELFAAPLDITAFIDTLRDDQPSNLVGLAWFRVPTLDDERAWSLETWHAVIDAANVENAENAANGANGASVAHAAHAAHAADARRAPLSADINAIAEPSAEIPGLYDVYLRNRGQFDATVPERVTISSSAPCEAADAVAPYVMAPYATERGRTAIEFRRVTPRLLARERRTLIGWVRCPSAEIQVHAGS